MPTFDTPSVPSHPFGEAPGLCLMFMQSRSNRNTRRDIMSAKVTLKGIVGINPELKEFAKSKKVRFTVASRSNSKETTWFNVEAWNEDTELVLENISKGQMIEVTGNLRLSLYESKKHRDKRLDATVSLQSFKIHPRAVEEEATVQMLSA